MNLHRILLLSVFMAGLNVHADSRLVSNLEAGEQQVVVTFGTSLTAVGAWVDQLRVVLEQHYPEQVTLVNGAQGGANSDWGRENLDEKVLKHKPDTVFIEFSVNDGVASRRTSVEHARGNLNNMIDRILDANPDGEIILMVMNPAIGFTQEKRPNLLAYNEMYREVARERNFQLIDHYPVWEKLLNEDPLKFLYYVPDTIHPVRIGAVNIITPTMTRALGLKPGQPELNNSTPCWKYIFRGLMDKDKDRVTTRLEFNNYWKSVFDKNDTNSDGLLVAGELPASLCRALDHNQDGSVSVNEYLQLYNDHFNSYKPD